MDLLTCVRRLLDQLLAWWHALVGHAPPRPSRSAAVQPAVLTEWSVATADNRTEYSGMFYVSDPRWRQPVAVRGFIVEWPGLPTDVYLFDPPEMLRQHRHGPCLQLLKPDQQWFRLHWAKPALTFEQSRYCVEQMMWEAANDAGPR